jgi:ATP-dependent DNA helicase HFM1/MER3
VEQKYKALVQGKTILESSLHINLAEHLNSEIGLGTITDIDSAKNWLRSSFLYQRMKKNPNYYSLGTKDNQTYEECIDGVVMDSVMKLKKAELIEHVESGKDSGELASTQYGEIMSKVRSLIFLNGFRLIVPCSITLGRLQLVSVQAKIRPERHISW